MNQRKQSAHMVEGTLGPVRKIGKKKRIIRHTHTEREDMRHIEIKTER